MFLFHCLPIILNYLSTYIPAKLTGRLNLDPYSHNDSLCQLNLDPNRPGELPGLLNLIPNTFLINLFIDIKVYLPNDLLRFVYFRFITINILFYSIKFY
jgi:hypothetical protein